MGVAGYGTIPMADASADQTASTNGSGNTYGNVPVKQAADQYSAVPAGKAPSSGYGDLPAPAPGGGAAAAAAGDGEDARWQPLRDTEGRLYYVNSQTGETSWTKPDTNKRAVPLATYQHLTQVKAGDMNRSRPPPDRVAVAGATNLPNSASGRGGGGAAAAGGAGAGAADARRRAATSPTRPSAAARAAALSQRRLEKSGWMSKDGKPRWFLLREQMLYWFTREQPLGADVSRDVRNFIDLSNGCTVRPNYGAKRGGFELAIETTLPAKQFVFACQSQAELDGWLAALVEGRARGSEARINGHVRFDRQRRYAVLDASQLRFFADETCRELRAAIDLGSCQPLAPPTNGETTLVLKGALNRTYEIGFQDAAQTLEWRTALDNVQRKASEATQLKRVVTQRKLEHKMANALNGGGGKGGGGSGGINDTPPPLASSSSQSELEAPLAAGELPPMKEAKVNADVKDMPFFHSGRVGAEMAYDLLVGHRVGSYLVRESSRAGCFVVSWIQSDEAIVHTLLAPAPSGTGWIIEGDDRLYTSIMAILATYSMSYRYPVNAIQQQQ
jgi:hypothetical protein